MYHLDNLKRQKYYCNICKRNHYQDTEIGIKHKQNILNKKKQKIGIDKDDSGNIMEWMSNIIYASYERSLIAQQALQVQIAVIDQDAQKAFDIVYRMEGTNVRHTHPINFSLRALNRIIKNNKI